MAYRNKTYVCFDAGNDFDYYQQMLDWKADDNIDFNFYDAHDLNNLREDSQEAGDSTKNSYKHVRWEIEVALNLEIPIISVNIEDGNTSIDKNYPPILRNELVINIQFQPKLIQYSIDNWITEHNRLKKLEEINNRVWKDHIYQSLGLN